jgi:hypothetical protein
MQDTFFIEQNPEKFFGENEDILRSESFKFNLFANAFINHVLGHR